MKATMHPTHISKPLLMMEGKALHNTPAMEGQNVSPIRAKRKVHKYKNLSTAKFEQCTTIATENIKIE